MTCNPLWPHITTELFPGQTAQDRPDIVSKVFNLKLKQLLHDLKEGKVFGKTVAFIYVIEFQKRGLPHAHILLILHSTNKPHTPADIDCLCRASHSSRIIQHDRILHASWSLWDGKSKCTMYAGRQMQKTVP